MKSSNIKSNIPLLTCAILAALSTGGPTYAFGLYGASLKDTLQLTQAQLDTLSSANFCAGLFTWIPGLLVDRYGVRTCMSLGGLMGAVFMGLYWVIARQWVVLASPASTLAALCACGLASFIGNGLVIGSIYKILVCTCTTTTKGSAVGAAKGYVGLGSGVYACLFQATKSITHSSSDLDFLPMAALLALGSVTLPALLLLPSHQEMQQLWSLPVQDVDHSNKRHFTLIYAGLFALAVVIVGTSLSELPDADALRHDNQTYQHLTSGIIILFLWLAPLLGLQWISTNNDDEREYFQTQGSTLSDLEGSELANGSHLAEQSILLLKEQGYTYTTESETTCQTYKDEMEATIPISKQHEPTVVSYTLTELIKTCHAWMLLWVGLVLVGSGTMMTNNMAQMVQSLELPTQAITASMAIFSVAQATARILAGALSDFTLTTQYPIPRPFFLVVASFIGAVAHTVLAMAEEHNTSLFLIGVALAGVAFGMIWPLMVLIVGEVFGKAHMATNYLFYDGLASAMGTLLLSKYITQSVYEVHIEEPTLDTDWNDTNCYGVDCFRASHWAAVILACSALLASLYLLRQTRHVYVCAYASTFR